MRLHKEKPLRQIFATELIWSKSPEEQKENLVDTIQSQIQMDLCFGEQKQNDSILPARGRLVLEKYFKGTPNFVS